MIRACKREWGTPIESWVEGWHLFLEGGLEGGGKWLGIKDNVIPIFFRVKALWSKIMMSTPIHMRQKKNKTHKICMHAKWKQLLSRFADCIILDNFIEAELFIFQGPCWVCLSPDNPAYTWFQVQQSPGSECQEILPTRACCNEWARECIAFLLPHCSCNSSESSQSLSESF